MDKLEKMNQLVKKIFEKLDNFIVFPFAIVGLVFISLFYVIFPIYMLADMFVKDLQSIIYNNSDKDSNCSKSIKVLLGFGCVVTFNFIKAVFALPLAMYYFATSLLFFVSSLGKIKTSPFAFSEENIVE